MGGKGGGGSFARAAAAHALVDIKINDCDSTHACVVACPLRGDREIVEDREARAEVAVRVVRSASKIGGQAVLQRKSRCEDRPCDLQSRALDQPCVPSVLSEANAPLRLGIKCAAYEAAVVGTVMNGFKPLVWWTGRLVHVLRRHYVRTSTAALW